MEKFLTSYAHHQEKLPNGKREKVENDVEKLG